MRGALSGITVLDFSQLLAGPFATQMMGDLGADIIKIEKPHDGDLFRHLTFFNKKIQDLETPCFLAWNRNKRSLAIDLKHPEGKKVIYHLAESADVAVQNFRPGVLERLGFGYEDLKKINPGIIYANNSGFGASGPYRNRPGQDLLVQSLSGVAKLTGRKSDPPTPLGVAIPDQLSAFHLVYGILAALYHREKTGEGQEVSVDLLRSTLALESQELMTLLNMDVEYERPDSGIGHPFSDAPFGIYRCSDGYIALAMGNFAKLTEALAAPELLETFSTPEDRFARRDELFYAIEAITRRKPKAYWLEMLLGVDYWVAEVKDITEIPSDPQVKHMNGIIEYEHAELGRIRAAAPAVSMSKTPPAVEKAPPMLGQHSREILKEYGFEADYIERLISEGVVTVHGESDA